MKKKLEEESQSRKNVQNSLNDESAKASSTTDSASKKAAFRVFNIPSIGFDNSWENKHGNWVLRPTDGIEPMGVIHFIGGAFVGAAPHLTYKYLLESLCEAGYVVVATPYRLQFDYTKSCDAVLEKFDRVAVELAGQYGPLPVIGLGHSCGALLQTLITCLFPGAPRAANVLISFNNKPAKDAIPAFDEIIVPFSTTIMNENSEQSSRFRDDVSKLRALFDSTVDAISSSSIVPAFVENEVVPILQQGLEIVDQFPDILRMINEGSREFNPTPADTKEVCRRMYRARTTLLLKFKDDSLDESEDIEKVLREANTIMRMKRPMIEMEVELKQLEGSHITPLTQSIFDPHIPETLGIPSVLIENPIRDQLEANFLKTIDEVKSEIIRWLDVKVRRK